MGQLRLAMLIIQLFALSGCASVVSYQLNHFTHDGVDLSSFAALFTKHHYCPVPENSCLHYFYAGPLNEPDTDIDFTLTIKTKAETIKKQLWVPADNIPSFNGTVALLHGFGLSKEAMLMNAQYFRSLGFHVVATDLNGHGDSTTPRGMGVIDANNLAEFLSNNTSGMHFPRPLFIAGHSMGALAALHTAKKMTTPPDGLILLAPMQRLDKAAVALGQLNSCWYTALLDDNDIVEGVTRVLSEKHIAPEQTDSMLLIENVSVPTIVFASERDSIAPYSLLTDIDNPVVNIYQVKETPHEFMLWLEQWQHELLVHFFSEYGHAEGIKNAG